ncbi:unannotated protein [freshwater metagenome]|uniref:Unannotated protein n=1 Tax=freshwater metagenome TaxID=449393 RepID=A0A6J7HES1_9ZZZZ
MTVAAATRVADALRAEGGLLADALLDTPQIPADDPQFGRRAAAGPRSAQDPATVAAVIEAVHEGHLLHHGRSRLLDTADRDLALLAGDRLYALGLDWLAATGDMEAVRELADLIGLCARAQAEQHPQLAAAAWEAAVAAIGWGSTVQLADAKAAIASDAPGAVADLAGEARRITSDGTSPD